MGSLVLFQNVAITRAAVMDEVAKKFARLSEDERVFRSMALDIITEPKIRRYIENTHIIENLFAYGRTNVKLCFPGEGAHFFESVKEVEARMSQLYGFWKGSVNITCDIADDSMVEVTFRTKRLDEF